MKAISPFLLCCVCCCITAAQPQFTLDQLLDSALTNNITMRDATRDIESAALQRREAFTNFFPSITGTAMTFAANRDMAVMEMDPSEYITPELGAVLAQAMPAEALMALSSPMTISMMKNGTIAGVNAVLPIFAGGQIVNGNRLARLGEDVARLKLKLSANDVERQLTEYFWQLASLMQKCQTLNSVDSLLTSLEGDAQAAVNAGLALRNDLLQVQLRRNEIASNRLKVNNGISLLQLIIAQFCGLSTTDFTITIPATASPSPSTAASPFSPSPSPSPSAAAASSFSPAVSPSSPSTAAASPFSPSPSPSPFPVATVPEAFPSGSPLPPSPIPDPSAVKFLPEYQLLEANLRAATLQRRMELGKRLPSLAVGAGYNFHNLLDNNRHFGMVFATLSVPVTDWWGGSYAIRRKRIAEQQAREKLNDNAQLLAIRQQKAANDLAEAQAQLQLAASSISQAEENLRIQRNTYQAGTSTMSDLLQAQLLLQQAFDARTDATATLQNARLAYRQAFAE